MTRIWCDITNSPHVLFFSGMLEHWATCGEVTVTARDLANTFDLLRQYNIDYRVVGRHYGRATPAKLLGFFARVAGLYNELRSNPPSVAVSHSSFYSPVVGRLLGAQTIYINDNEHAKGNLVAGAFADLVLIPEFLDPARLGVSARRVRQYPGVKEGVYLWRLRQPGETRCAKVVYVRPEPGAAQYYNGPVNFLPTLIRALSSDAQVCVLARGPVQREELRRACGDVALFPDHPVPISDILRDAALFIGAGGTMTREAAVAGIPTISVYQSERLQVDDYLISRGAMAHRPQVTASEALTFMREQQSRGPIVDLLEKGREAHEMISDLVVQGRR